MNAAYDILVMCGAVVGFIVAVLFIRDWEKKRRNAGKGMPYWTWWVAVPAMVGSLLIGGFGASYLVLWLG